MIKFLDTSGKEFTASKRTSDNYGSGSYKASRGKRIHNGQDFAAPKGSICLSATSGIISKFGYPYADKLEYRYVEVTTDGLKLRYFYVQPDPCLIVGDNISKRTRLGLVQDLTTAYPNGMTNHVHFEIKQKDGSYIDPNEYLKSISK